MAHDVFISYSSKDKTVADATCATLEANGIRCWMAPRDIRPSDDWGEAIIDAIQGSAAFVLIFSANANASPQIKREVERAINKGIPFIPLRIENVMPAKSLEYFLSTPHWLDAYSPPMERHLNYLTEVVRSVLDNKPAPPAPPNPVQGGVDRRLLLAGGAANAGPEGGAFSDGQIETLAKMEHWRWSVALRLRGWTQGPRDEYRRTHPLLTAWDALSEGDRETNREMVRRIPAILQATRTAAERPGVHELEP